MIVGRNFVEVHIGCTLRNLIESSSPSIINVHYIDVFTYQFLKESNWALGNRWFMQNTFISILNKNYYFIVLRFNSFF